MSQHARIDYPQHVPEHFRALLSLSQRLHKGSIGESLAALVMLRVSQINGCVYCLDMHAATLRRLGETDRRLDTLAAWRENRLFDNRERAALGWAEALTRIEATGAPDADYEPLPAHFDERGIAELSFVVAVINAWNRLAVGLRTPLP